MTKQPSAKSTRGCCKKSISAIGVTAPTVLTIPMEVEQPASLSQALTPARAGQLANMGRNPDRFGIAMRGGAVDSG